MLTAHKIKILQSLEKKKFRQKYNLFLVEGNKTIKEIPKSKYKIKELYCLNPHDFDNKDLNIVEITTDQLKKISFLQNPKDSIAVCELIEHCINPHDEVQLILDGIQDPGNLGTIIRLADWFGIDQIICSEDTVDYYNPKVIQASMGSFLRVNIAYTSLETYFAENDTPIIGTDMVGENMYQYKFPQKFSLVLGNEGNGIRPEMKNLLTNRVTIPRFGNTKSTESLNVAMSAGIILSKIFSNR
ncbi:RNA methyltransferase [Chryseobacterium sp. SNU WT5]|uniref:RNA methyltransferase n=1 Tax=Chryseobacterium sp. SNU WT5 TaxID=2594269 RepID=UPI00117D7BA5|nr:RNA methyltransferase [Chryseobacterium sp. SNU WT5]QDP86569.1 RNA methyltransferase [Chryseobacterium sp. SNU WT5]